MYTAVVLKHKNCERLKSAIKFGFRKPCGLAVRRKDANKMEENNKAPEQNFFSGNMAIALVFPFCAHGSLEHFLKFRAHKGLSLNWMLQVAKSVAEGLKFLISRDIRHRDLAARNSLLSSPCSYFITNFR